MTLREEIHDHFEKSSNKLDAVVADQSEIKQCLMRIETVQKSEKEKVEKHDIFIEGQKKTNNQQIGFFSALAIGWGLLINFGKEIFHYFIGK